MFKKFSVVLCLICLSGNAYSQVNDRYLPSALKKDLLDACTTKNAFVISVVRKEVIRLYPNFSASIQHYLLSDCRHEAEEKLAQEKQKLNPKSKTEEKKPWKSAIEAGVSISHGNTEQENLNLDFKSTYDDKKSKTTLKASALNRSENDTRTAEEYRANLNSRYKLNDKKYLFGELEYVNDRFSGYQYRVSENIGYGRIFIKSKKTNLEAEASIGARHSKLTNDKRENSLIQKNTGRFSYQLTDNILFSEQASIAFGRDATITTSETSLKTQIANGLYLNFSLTIENISKVPAGTKNTDTLTKLNLGYNF